MGQNHLSRGTSISIWFIVAALLTACKGVRPTSVSTRLLSLTPNPTQIPSLTATPSPMPTATHIPTSTATLTRTPRPTNTPLPDVNLESFVFPYAVPQVVDVWNHYPGSAKYFTFHITHRPDHRDPCGYHPGDIIAAIGISGQDLSGFNIDVMLPYTGTLINAWLPGGGGEAFTFRLGLFDGREVNLDSYHTNISNLTLQKTITQGDIYAHFNTTFVYGGWREAKVHMTLFYTQRNGSTDYMNAPSLDIIDLAPYALPPTLKAMYENSTNLLIIYEGANFCNMTQEEKIQAILSEYLPNAGFCVEGATVSYCGPLENYQGLVFTQYTNDARSVMLTPLK